MRIALLIAELPMSSVPKTLGEEAYHLSQLGAESDIYVIKQRIGEVPPAHADHVKVSHIDVGTGILSKACSVRIPSFSFLSLHDIVYPFILTGRASKILDEYDAIIAQNARTAIFASRLRVRKARMAFYYLDPISEVFRLAYKDSWNMAKYAVLSSIAPELDRRLLSKPDVILLLSKFFLRRIRQLAPEKPVRVVYLGVKSAEEIPRKRGSYLLCAKRWESLKSPLFLASLARRLKERRNVDFKIKLVGPWRNAKALVEFRDLLVRHDLQGSFDILGPRSECELERLYLGARALLHVETDSFGMMALEAAGHGCPIIIPRGSGVTELLQHGVHGFFPEEGKIGEFVVSVESLIGDERLAWSMGKEAWGIARQYSWENHAKNLLQAIEC